MYHKYISDQTLVGISDRILRILTNYFRIPVIQGGITILPELLSSRFGPSACTFFWTHFWSC